MTQPESRLDAALLGRTLPELRRLREELTAALRQRELLPEAPAVSTRDVARIDAEMARRALYKSTRSA